MTLAEQWHALCAAGKVRWMPGMLARYSADSWYRVRDGERGPPDPRSAVPDFTDPATIGCLVAQINERVTWHWTAPH